MKPLTLVALTLLVLYANSISEFDFNACRISNCNAQEINCVSDEYDCLNHFGQMRACVAACPDPYENFNPCWATCKNEAARTNTHWLSLSYCYENVCYAFEKWIAISLIFLIFLGLF